MEQHGGVCCVALGDDCKMIYSDHTIASHVPRITFNAYFRAKSKNKETLIVQELERGFDRRVSTIFIFIYLGLHRTHIFSLHVHRLRKRPPALLHSRKHSVVCVTGANTSSSESYSLRVLAAVRRFQKCSTGKWGLLDALH